MKKQKTIYVSIYLNGTKKEHCNHRKMIEDAVLSGGLSSLAGGIHSGDSIK